MPAFSVNVHEHGGCGVFGNLRTCFAACFCKSFFGVVHHEFFAKGVDEALGSSAYYEFVRIFGSKLHGVAYLVSPKSARG